MQPLIRIGNQRWSLVLEIDEQPLQDCPTPQPSNIEVQIKGENFEIVHTAATLIHILGLEHVKRAKTLFYFPHIRSLQGTWRINVIPPTKSVLSQIAQRIFSCFTSTAYPRNIQQIAVTKIDGPDLYFQAIKKILPKNDLPVKRIAVDEIDIESMPQLSCSHELSVQERIMEAPFSDPFTKAATDAFARWEKSWDPRQYSIPSTQLVVKKGMLSLQRFHFWSSTDEEKNHKETCRLFYEFIVREYGKEVIDHIEHQFTFSFQELIKKGTALLPEHVWMVNIGANTIEQKEVERLWKKLPLLLKRAKEADPNIPLLTFFKQQIEKKPCFSVREMRGIFHRLPCLRKDTPPIKDLINYLEDFITQTPIQQLPPSTFNELLSILWTPETRFSSIFTGRGMQEFPPKKISIFSYPRLEKQQILQTFTTLSESNNWNGFYETLAHILAKKPFLQSERKEHWPIGALIPAPKTSEGYRRWYRVDCISNSEKNIQHLLLPACKDPSLPIIALCTASTSNHLLKNNDYFKKYTIPVWFGYYLTTKKKLDAIAPAATALFQKIKEKKGDLVQVFHEAETISSECHSLSYDLEKALNCWKKNHQDPVFQRPEPVTKESITADSIELLAENIENHLSFCHKTLVTLDQSAKKEKEKLFHKEQQNIVFLGHGNAGAVAQKNFLFSCPEKNRIPIPKATFSIRTFNSLPISKKREQQFAQFGADHGTMMAENGCRYVIQHDMEYGDATPFRGGLHLGAMQKTSTYKDWLQVAILINKPLITAQAHGINYYPTHYRRFYYAIEGIDYKQTQVTPQALARFNNSLFLDQEQASLWGFRSSLPMIISEIFYQTIVATKKHVAKVEWVMKKLRLLPIV